jgi:hypothetical protein
MESIAIRVVNLRQPRSCCNLPVHTNSATRGFSRWSVPNRIPHITGLSWVFGRAPVPLVEPFKIAIVNNGHLTLCQRNFFHSSEERKKLNDQGDVHYTLVAFRAIREEPFKILTLLGELAEAAARVMLPPVPTETVIKKWSLPVTLPA